MPNKLLLVAFLSIAVLFISCATSTPQLSYHKPGSTDEQMRFDLDQCKNQAAEMWAGTGGRRGAAVMDRERQVELQTEDCMKAKGYALKAEEQNQ
jgi:hypothetical protein